MSNIRKLVPLGNLLIFSWSCSLGQLVPFLLKKLLPRGSHSLRQISPLLLRGTWLGLPFCFFPKERLGYNNKKFENIFLIGHHLATMSRPMSYLIHCSYLVLMSCLNLKPNLNLNCNPLWVWKGYWSKFLEKTLH